LVSGVTGNCTVNILENGKPFNVTARSLFHRLMGKKKASRRTTDKAGKFDGNGVLIQTSNGFYPIKHGICDWAAIAKIRGDRTSISTSFHTKLYEKDLGWSLVNSLYGQDSKIKYINLKNEFTYDWIVQLTIPYNDPDGFIYDFVTDIGDFIANRILVLNAK
jgi:hypothetical protein